jgi:hypothetical protein
MKSDAIAYTVAGMCFGIILGWVIWNPAGQRAAAPQVAQNTASQAAQAAAPAKRSATAAAAG